MTMPAIALAPGVVSSVPFIYGSIEAVTLEATIKSSSSGEIDLELGKAVFKTYGTGLNTSNLGMCAGTITGRNVVVSRALAASLTQRSRQALRLQAAVNLETTNSLALATIFYPLGRIFHGNVGQDIILPTSQSADGILCNLSGNDHVYTGSGNDTIFPGDGAARDRLGARLGLTWQGALLNDGAVV